MTVTPPRPVVPARISIPARAGTCDPEKFLSGVQLRIYQNLDGLVLPEEQWEDPLPRPCHMVSVEDESVLRRMLCESGMAELVPESEVPRGRGNRKLLSGLFSVPHKIEKDRLIIDRRPQNATERRLGWSDLPHGTLFTRLRLGPSQAVRASIDDISCYF